MPSPLIFLTIPGLRESDVAGMPALQNLMSSGSRAPIGHPNLPITWPSQASMLTGTAPSEHGVIANGFFWRESGEVEMWTAWNEVIQRPQIWDVLHEMDPKVTSAAWFPMLSKGCGADFVCMPAPIHQPDGSEDLWCYTKPQEFYGELLERFEHFPLKHFWGPLSNIKSSKWIADSSVAAADKFAPQFFYIYLPHLDYAAQKNGPNSPEAVQAVQDLDQLIAEFSHQMQAAYGQHDQVPDWMVVSEYEISEVDHVTYPNRVLRDAGLVEFSLDEEGREQLDFSNSRAWALVDHQISHVFVKDADPAVIDQVVQLFDQVEGIEKVLTKDSQQKIGWAHERSGEIMLVSSSNSWQAYYWWTDDQKAPEYARAVDIHNKPGYDPVELCFDMSTMSVPLDATLIKGSHGVPRTGGADGGRGGLLLSSKPGLNDPIIDTDVFEIVLNHFRR